MKVKEMSVGFPAPDLFDESKKRETKELLHNGKSGKIPVPQVHSESVLTVFGHLKLRKVKL